MRFNLYFLNLQEAIMAHIMDIEQAEAMGTQATQATQSTQASQAFQPSQDSTQETTTVNRSAPTLSQRSVDLRRSPRARVTKTK